MNDLSPIYQRFMEETHKTLNTKVVGAVAAMLGLQRVLLNPINGPARSWELSQNPWSSMCKLFLESRYMMIYDIIIHEIYIVHGKISFEHDRCIHVSLYHWFIPNPMTFIWSTISRLSGPVGGSIDRHYQREAVPQVHYNKVTENVQWLEAHPQLMDIHDLS